MFMEPSDIIERNEFNTLLDVNLKKKELRVKIKGLGCQNLLGMGESCQWITETHSPMDRKSLVNTVPSELLLSYIASQASLEMLSVIRENQIPLLDFYVEAEADFADVRFSNLNEVDIHYTLVGENINPEDIDSLVTTTSERCKFANLLKKDINLITDFKIEYPD